MSNTYGISEHDEREIRARDKTCVYCHIVMKQPPTKQSLMADLAPNEYPTRYGGLSRCELYIDALTLA